MTDHPGEYGTALAVVNRYRYGWQASRNGSGFLVWFKHNVYEAMTEDEAAVYHDAVDADRHAPHIDPTTAHIDGRAER